MKKREPMFLVNEENKKTGVLLKIADFEKMMEKLEDYTDYKMIMKRSKKNYKTYTREEILEQCANKK